MTAKGPGYGMVKIYIDNVLRSTVDLYAGSQTWKSRLAFTGLAAGGHTIKVQPTGTKNASSSMTKVVLVAFVVH